MKLTRAQAHRLIELYGYTGAGWVPSQSSGR